MNRKLIRPNLADMKGKERDLQSARERSNDSNMGRQTGMPRNVTSGAPTVETGDENGATANAGKANPRRSVPPTETNAEVYYYKKQIDAHTEMVIVLTDNEEVEGTIEWYDRNALKVNRKNAPNIMLLKHNIKYMYKAEDRI